MADRASLQALVPGRLAEEIKALNPRQRRAVLHGGSLVVQAGPGTGKTRTLVAKVAYLLAAVVPPRRAVAAMTYTNQAAGEVTRRLARLGLHPGRRLVSRTVHSWCLTAILQPYAALTGTPLPTARGVVADDDALVILRGCLDDADVLYQKAAWEQPLITRIRRSIAAHQDVEGYDEAKVTAARLFDHRLIERDLIDYEAMVSRALELVRNSAPVRDLLAARYPWLVVDEYQDLGPVLHELVLTLHDRAGVRVCAVGDPDQSVMGFTGADPRYLNELVDHEAFLDIGLDLNYRSGSAIIAASHAALGGARDHRADPNREDAGVVEPVAVSGGLVDHAETCARKIQDLIAAGVAVDRIAVLYPRRGPLLDRVQRALTTADIGYLHERDQRLPTGSLVDFLRRCAARRLAGPQPCGHGPAMENGATVPVIAELAHDYLHLRAASEFPRMVAIDVARRLEGVLDAKPEDSALPGEEPIVAFVARLDAVLDLSSLAAASYERRDRNAFEAVAQLSEEHAVTLEQFAGPDLLLGKVVLTTYHSAKGREFSVVLLPGLVEGIVPRLDWSKSLGTYQEPARAVVAEERRTFYVALTRAADAAVLIYGSRWETEWGASNELGPSRFVVDVVERLREGGE